MRKGTLSFLSTILGAAVGVVGASYYTGKQVKQKSEKVEKFRGYYNILNQWLILKQEGKTIERFFTDHEYHTIAIYGIGEMGSRLYDDLRNTSIKVKYAIDKDVSSTTSDLDVVSIDDDLEDVDAIIVTATFAFDDIMKELTEKVDYPIVSLEDVIFEI